MTAYYMEVPNLELQTLIEYNETFKKVLKDLYNIYPKIDWIDKNKDSFDGILQCLPEKYERGNTIHYNCSSGNVCYGYSYEYLVSNHTTLVQVTSNTIFIGVI